LLGGHAHCPEHPQLVPPVGDHEYGSALHQPIHTLLDQGFGSGVNGACCLIQNQYRGIRHSRPGNGKQLPLTLTQVDAVGGQHGLIALGQVGDEAVGIGQLCCRNDLFVRSVQLAVPDIVHYRAGEQVGILEHHGQGVPQVVLLDLVDVDAIVPDLSVRHIVEPVDEVCNGGFPSTGGSHKGNLLTGGCIQAYILQNFLVGLIAEGHIVKFHIASHPCIGQGAVMMGMLPCPDTGVVIGFRQSSVRRKLCVYQRYIAVIHLRLLIDQTEDTLCTSQGGQHRIELLGQLGHRLGEASGVLKEYHHRTKA